MTYTIQQLKGGTDNCYLVTDGTNAVLVDTSSGESREMVMDACSKYDLKLVVLTHPHFDHAENAAAISEKFGVPVAYHRADDGIFDSYDSQPLRSYGLVGFVVLQMSLKVLREIKVERPANCVFVAEGDTLEDYGFPDVKVIELPGHTAGSIGLLVQDHSLIAGDALDNWIAPGMGHLCADLGAMKSTYAKIRALGPRTIYYGHGKPTVQK